MLETLPESCQFSSETEGKLLAPESLPSTGDYVEFYHWSWPPALEGQWRSGLVIKCRLGTQPTWDILGSDGEMYRHRGMMKDTNFEIKLIQRREHS